MRPRSEFQPEKFRLVRRRSIDQSEVEIEAQAEAEVKGQVGASGPVQAADDSIMADHRTDVREDSEMAVTVATPDPKNVQELTQYVRNYLASAEMSFSAPQDAAEGEK